MAANASSVCATKPCGMPGATKSRVAAWKRDSRSSLPGRWPRAYTPTATNATSFTSDSSATARIMPWWCSVASICRVPNAMANTASSSATYSAGSVSGVRGMSCCTPESTLMLIATALNCSAM